MRLRSILSVLVLLGLCCGLSSSAQTSLTDRQKIEQARALIASVTPITSAGRTNKANILTRLNTLLGQVANDPPPPPPPVLQCNDGLDNDKDGLVDMADPGCGSAQDNDETNAIVLPPPCNFSLGQTSNSFPAQASTATVSLTASQPTACPWTASSAVAWLTVTTSGTGSSTVSYSAQANATIQPRTGVLTIAGQSFTVTQDATSLPPPPPPGGSLCVNGTSGSDAQTIAQVRAGQCWRTIGRAAWGSTNRDSPNPNEAARAGDTVLVAAGTYTVQGTGLRYIPAYTPANSGTEAAPIVFQANGLVTLTQTGNGPVIGAYQRNWITFRGFTIDERNAPVRGDTGVAVLWYCNGCTFDGNTIKGDPNFRPGDNHPGIRTERSANFTITNNTISDWFCSVVNSSNGSGIEVYFGGSGLIAHNVITNSGSGIFLKAPFRDSELGPDPRIPGPITIRNNRIQDVGLGIAVHRAPTTADKPIQVYQNLLLNTNTALRIWPFDQPGGSGTTEPMHVKLVNNTSVTTRECLLVSNDLIPNAGHVYKNNVCVGGTLYAVNFGGAQSSFRDKARIDLDRNLYWNFTQFIVYTTTTNFAGWKAFGQDTNAINVDPLLQGTYCLQAGSPAQTLGLDVLDLNKNGSTTDTIPAGAFLTCADVMGPVTR